MYAQRYVHMHRGDTLSTDAVESAQIVTRAQNRNENSGAMRQQLYPLHHCAASGIRTDTRLKEDILMNNEFAQKVAKFKSEFVTKCPLPVLLHRATLNLHKPFLTTDINVSRHL